MANDLRSIIQIVQAPNDWMVVIDDGGTKKITAVACFALVAVPDPADGGNIMRLLPFIGGEVMSLPVEGDISTFHKDEIPTSISSKLKMQDHLTP